MINLNKIKMLLNDPKFQPINISNQDQVEQALHKIYVKQKQIRRYEIVEDEIQNKRYAPSTTFNKRPQVAKNVDFFQKRLQTLESNIAVDIQKTFLTKQLIKENYYSIEQLYEKNYKKAKILLGKVDIKPDQQNYLQKYEQQFEDIRELVDDNVQLKQQVQELRKKIQVKNDLYNSLNPKT